MAQLAVNVDHIATIREARKVNYPDPVAAAIAAEIGGADGIVVHLRGDRRHIQERDVTILRDVVRTKLILEMASTPEMLAIAGKIKPDLVTLVPERREEVSTEGGLDIITHEQTTRESIHTLQNIGIPVSIFIDPDWNQIKMADKLGADMIE
ncbi:MAG: pyridoxine 5'-phosphate synthase, partial [Desulfamplus sp.]|nr:pyridoxine 5'-phosphate synthase [Desulfamplus sp.]